jgi:hypothetical protein
MMRCSLRTIVGAIGLLVIAVTVSQAADLKKAMSETEGRKKAAENGLKEIKAKGQPSEELQRSYIDAASQQNAWLDSVCGALEQGAPATPDVSTVAQSAASSLVEWVNHRNRALGLAELTGAIAESVKKKTSQDLVDIATETWKDNRSGDAKKRMTAAAALKERLRWKTFEEVQ